MLARIFRTHQPAALLLLFVLVPLLWSGAWVHPVPTDDQGTMLLYRPFAALFRKVPWTGPTLGMLVSIAVALQLNLLADRTELLERRSNLPALLFPLLLCSAPVHVATGPALLGMPLVLFALDRAWRVQERPRVQGVLFDAGLAVGIAGMFHLPYLFYLVVLWASIAVMRPFSWREYVLPALGVSLVLCFDAAAHVLFGLGDWSPGSTLIAPVIPAVPVGPAAWQWIAPAIVLVLFLFGVFRFARAYGRSVMWEKNLRSAFLAFVLASLVLAAFGRFLTGETRPVLVAAPMALFLAFPLTHAPTWLAELITIGLLVAAFAGQWWAPATFVA
ncbi:MAG: hypothetical protein H6597_05705 [Flavobacteriales bacterium]|nr:hypothetical protein [Flavobacteriales bacterium]MCB9194010.1 hypothetical protein [Flavobacteriales bacterium]